MKTTDWRWSGSILRLPVRRHNHWHITILRNVQFRTAESPRWWLRLWRFSVAWWPNDKRRFVIGWQRRADGR